MGIQRPDFAEFYREAKDKCLFAVLVSVGDQDTAQDLVAEAFARAWASWPAVSRHPAPAAWVVRTALNAGISRWRRWRREVPVPDLARVADQPATANDRREPSLWFYCGPQGDICRDLWMAGRPGVPMDQRGAGREDADDSTLGRAAGRRVRAAAGATDRQPWLRTPRSGNAGQAVVGT